MPGCWTECCIPDRFGKAPPGLARLIRPLSSPFQPADYLDSFTALIGEARKEKNMATRADAIENAREQLRSGAFLGELNRRVGYRTESQNSGSGAALRAYLVEDLQ